jgi:hypothetical protein
MLSQEISRIRHNLVLEGGPQITICVEFLFLLIMAHTLGHDFSSPEPTRCFLRKPILSLIKPTYDGENGVSIVDHVLQFMIKCNSFNIINENEICRLFSLTFKGRIQEWYKTLLDKSVHSWEYFIDIFLLDHHCYDYDKLCLEIGSLSMHEDESIEEFYDRFKSLCFRFHLKDLPSEEDLSQCFKFLVSSSCKHNKSNKDEQDNIDAFLNPIEPLNELENFQTLKHLEFPLQILKFRKIIIQVHL